MQGHKQFVDKVVLRFQLSERVPKHNLYRRLAELLDWDSLYQQTQAFYSHIGQPSLDLVVFFKLMLVSRLENLVSDRQLIAYCSLRLDILYFLGYEVDEDRPWHSTISRTRQLYPAAVFEHLFDHVFAQCVAAGLVAGHTQVVDSAPVKANASLHGFDCCFEHSQTKQYLEASIIHGEEYGVLDPYFFAKYILSSKQYYPLPVEIYDEYTDGKQVIEQMLRLGKFELINSNIPHRATAVVTDRVKVAVKVFD